MDSSIPKAFQNCPVCHLSLPVERVRAEECPRCRNRDDESVPMFLSPLPYRLLAGPIFQKSSGEPTAPR
jgi:hypothetical protein